MRSIFALIVLASALQATAAHAKTRKPVVCLTFDQTTKTEAICRDSKRPFVMTGTVVSVPNPNGEGNVKAFVGTRE